MARLTKDKTRCGHSRAPKNLRNPQARLEVQMRPMLRWMSALCMLSVSTTACAGSLPPGFTVGYNEAWIENNYGNWLASNPLFSEPSGFIGNPTTSPVNTVFLGMANGNAKIVRIFLFPAVQGIRIKTSASPQTQGLTGEFLGNLSTVFSWARNNHLKLYITALNANDANVATPSNYPALHTYYQNLFSNSVETNAYETLVLAPILSLMSQNKDVIYGFDLIDEIEAAINAGYFSNYWIGARAWIQNMTTYVTSKASWLPVTSTAGWGYAVQEVTLGLFSRLGLNYYDVHIYSDSGQYSGQTVLCSKTKSDNLPIVLGEFGQKSTTLSDTIQNTATIYFLYGAKLSCFSSALAWKYEATNQPWFSYLYITSGGGLGGPRPAYTTIQQFVP